LGSLVGMKAERLPNSIHDIILLWTIAFGIAL